ncbi:MAG: hypothetical protein M1825_000883 [Sarcosagium campestre]|nr:MAG: hypothetical protein M1825_000883 [Sarcosagium campestre]
MDRQRKRELAVLNARAWNGEKDVFKVNSSLDSSLKKNTAFIKRIRTAIASSTLNSLLQDIRTLSLHKYLSEVISACCEGLSKLKSPGEVSAGVEIVSALHQRFGPSDFTSYLGWLLGRNLATPEKAHLKALAPETREREEKERLSRQRVLLKVVTELWLAGVLKSLEDVTRPEDAAVRGKEQNATAGTKSGDGVGARKLGSGNTRANHVQDAEPFPLEVLKDLLGHDRDHTNLPLVVLFVKSFAWDVLGFKSPVGEGRKRVEDDGSITAAADGDYGSGTDEAASAMIADDPPLTSPDLQQRFRNVLTRYFEDVKEHLIRDQKTLSSQQRRNAEAYVKSGEIFEDRQANFDRQSRNQEKLIANAQVLSDTLNLDMPDLKSGEEVAGTADGGIGLVKVGDYLRGQGDGAGIWEDEEERRFYENLIDLKDRVPGILLEDGRKKKAEGEEQTGKRQEEKVLVSKDADKPSSVDPDTAPVPKTSEDDDQSTAIANKTVGAQVDALLARLPELTTKDLIDQAATDFCFLNSKASRNRLVKAVSEIPKGRSDLLPAYARLVATLARYMPDISHGLVSHLDSEFRSLQRRKDKDFLGQVRLSNIRYLAELTKFGVVPEHVIFHCLKVSLEDFSRMNIDIICNLLENCGRFLLRNPDTSPRMHSFLETLQRKKSAQHSGQQERMLIENAIYFVDPPQRAAIQQKERMPVDLFVRKLIYLDLNRRSCTKIVKQIRKLHWEEQEVVEIMTKVFSKPGKVKHSNISLLAIMLSAIYRYHQDFVICIVDDILERITVGLEQNDFKYNQRRLAEVKYLGELYNYKMIDSPVIFDTLYRIVTFGHEGGTPKPTQICPLDLPDDFFRIRLVCNLLETCGVCFDRGTAKKKLDFFLSFFQYYIYTKDTLPMDVEFLVQDTYQLTRPQWKLATDLAEAGRIFAEAIANNYKLQEAERAAAVDEQDEESSSDDADGDGLGQVDDIQSSGEEGEPAVHDDIQKSQSSSDVEEADEEIVVTRQEEERDPEADAEFDRELAKMTMESVDSRKFERKPIFDVPLPMRRVNRDQVGADEREDRPMTPPNTMAFSLLTKKGNRQQTRTVELPSDSNFAVAMKTQQEAEREEQQRIKSLVLNYDLRDEEDGLERQNASPQAKTDRSGNNRSQQRARKLQLGDIDWYDSRGNRAIQSHAYPSNGLGSGLTRPHGRGITVPRRSWHAARGRSVLALTYARLTRHAYHFRPQDRGTPAFVETVSSWSHSFDD